MNCDEATVILTRPFLRNGQPVVRRMSGTTRSKPGKRCRSQALETLSAQVSDTTVTNLTVHMRQVIESAAESGDGVCIGGTTQPADKLKHKTLMKTINSLSQSLTIAGGKSSSLGDVAKSLHRPQKCSCVLRQVGRGVAGGKSWDRAVYDAGKGQTFPHG